MKKWIRDLILPFIGKIVFWINPRKLKSILFEIHKIIHSSYIACRFNKVGEGCIFGKNLSIVGASQISLGNKVVFHNSCILSAYTSYTTPVGRYRKTYSPKLEIGDNCFIGEYNHITCVNHISIGNGFLSGRWVTITDNSHGDSSWNDLQIPPAERIVKTKGKVLIGKNVWVGDKVTILPGVVIGDGVIVAANTVVTHDVPPYSVVAGNPSRIVKHINKT